MKTQLTPIEVLVHFKNDGTLHPFGFKLADETNKIQQVVSVTEEKLAGNKMMRFRCQNEVNGELKPVEIKFELGTFQVVFVLDVKINKLAQVFAGPICYVIPRFYFFHLWLMLLMLQKRLL